MSILQTLILSIIEGVTEFLPISSTGHLVLASSFLNISQTDFVKSFEIAIQLGAIVAVVWLYRNEIIGNRALWPKVGIAFVPTAVLGLIFYPFIKTFLLGNLPVTLLALAIGGLILIGFEKVIKTGYTKIEDMTWVQALVAGMAQSASMIPGVSRAAATIVGGMSQGLSREEAVKFSFLLAIPTMAAATGLDAIKTGWRFDTFEFAIMSLGFVTAFVTAMLTVKWLVGFVRSHSFVGFGVYRLLLAGVFWWWMKWL